MVNLDNIGDKRLGNWNTRPLRPRIEDNALTTILKLMQNDFDRRASKLPRAEEDEFFYTLAEADLNVNPGVIPGGTGTAIDGTGVVLHFDERPEVAGLDLVPTNPRAQSEMYGMGIMFSTPVYNLGIGQDRFTTPYGTSKVTSMGGGSTVFRVDSDDDYCQVNEAARLITLPKGMMSVWIQGFDEKPFSAVDRNYFILDAGGKFRLWYEYSASPATSKIVWEPNSDEAFQLSIDIPTSTIFGWFGGGPVKLTLVWDYAEQVFEMYWGYYRAAEIPPDIIGMPTILGQPLSLGNSLGLGEAGGNEFALQHFDEWTFSKIVPGLKEVSSIDGYVAQSLLPIHSDSFMTACGNSATPINLAQETEPFDSAYIRELYARCAIYLGADPSYITSVLQSSGMSTNTEFYLPDDDGSVDDVLTRTAAGSSWEAPSVQSASPSLGIGYTTGAGGSITQTASKSQGVTLNTICGQITTHNANLAANTKVSFTVSNSVVNTTDCIILSKDSGGTAEAYSYWIDDVSGGSFTITLFNTSGGALAEVLVLNFAIIRSVSS